MSADGSEALTAPVPVSEASVATISFASEAQQSVTRKGANMLNPSSSDAAEAGRAKTLESSAMAGRHL